MKKIFIDGAASKEGKGFELEHLKALWRAIHLTNPAFG
jgi:hypothetical protein